MYKKVISSIAVILGILIVLMIIGTITEPSDFDRALNALDQACEKVVPKQYNMDYRGLETQDKNIVLSLVVLEDPNTGISFVETWEERGITRETLETIITKMLPYEPLQPLRMQQYNLVIHFSGKESKQTMDIVIPYDKMPTSAMHNRRPIVSTGGPVPSEVQEMAEYLNAVLADWQDEGLRILGVSIENHNFIFSLEIDESQLEGLTIREEFEAEGITPDEFAEMFISQNMLNSNSSVIQVLYQYHYNIVIRVIGAQTKETMDGMIPYDKLQNLNN